MPFATGPQLRYIGLGKYATVGPTLYVGKHDVITVPDGFDTDLATTPRIFWAFVPPHGSWERAAVLHDYGCVQLADGTCDLSARDVDGLFRRVLREEGVGVVTRWVMWWGVRVGALANPQRRAGWWRDLPLFAPITAALLTATSVGVYGLDRLAHFLLDLI